MSDIVPAQRGAGGTEGGVGTFFVGLMLAVGGAWLLTNQVSVVGGSWSLWGHSSFGLSLLPLIIGIIMLFFNGRSIVGWLFVAAGAVIIFLGILTNLDIYFRQTSLFNTLVMLTMLAAGIGLIAKAIKGTNPKGIEN
ncbi:MAG TPA: hypothetical protein VHL58_17935 [Thermoanaerobaculia bacterium]|nr:hypothetical protein [Thermoanaerobaculia bacterium]